MATTKVQRVEPGYRHRVTDDDEQRMRLHTVHVVVKQEQSSYNNYHTTSRTFVFTRDDDDGVLRHTKTEATGSDEMISMVPKRRAAMLEAAAEALRGWVDAVGRDYEIVTPSPQESDTTTPYDL